MDYIELGKTGLRVSKVGLGCGGHSRLGQSYGASEKDSIRLVREAIESGINYIDTARAYGTEPLVGKALGKLKRANLFLSTKCGLRDWRQSGKPLEQAVTEAIDESLKQLDTDYIDVYHVHGLAAEDAACCLEEVAPQLERAREAGKIRFLAVSEAFGKDTDHAMLRGLEPLDVFDVAMVGFNALNPSARKEVFPRLMEEGLGTEIMFAIRKALTSAERFREAVSAMVEAGQIGPDVFGKEDPAKQVFGTKDDAEIREISYRYAAYEPGADVVLVGTGKASHLRENVQAILKGPLPAERKAAIDEAFGEMDSVSGN